MKTIKTTLLICFCALCLIAPLGAMAQSGTNSPYSQYGLGVMADWSQGQSRGMGGTGIALRSGRYVNTLNPASFSSIDSLTMIIDAGVSGEITNYNENGIKKNAKTANFEYIAASFRVMPKLGLSVGILPYTNIGYNYSSTEPIAGTTTTTTQTFSGDGGIHQAYIGIGYNVWRGLSVGLTAAYLWGSYDKTLTISYSDAYVKTMTRTYSASVTNYKLDFGMQYQHELANKDLVTIGATYGLGHNIGGKPQLTTLMTDPQTAVSDTATSISGGLSLPHTFGIGLSWLHSKKILLALDYSLQKWGSADYPVANIADGTYTLQSGQLKDRHRVSFGAEWTPDATSRKLFNRVNYRIGASYATPYIKVNGNDGPKEYGVTAGVGIPITNAWNSRSLLNISAGWTHSSATGLLTENSFRINIGLTFNERWFMKWKVE